MKNIGILEIQKELHTFMESFFSQGISSSQKQAWK